MSPSGPPSHRLPRLSFRRAVLSCCVPALLAAGALLSACTAAPPATAPDFAGFRDFLVDRAATVLEARGVVSFAYRGEQQSGEVFVRTGPGEDVLLQLRARITGSLALEARFDARRLLVVDYVNRTYYQGDNTPETRESLFGLNLTPEEFRTLLTARVERRAFEAGRGTLLGPHEAVYGAHGDRYLFTLGDDGLPLSWVKQREHTIAFRVEYRGTLAVAAAHGEPVRLPERVRVYVDGAAPRMVLGVREFALPAQAPPLRFDLPPEAAGFTPQ